jgi:hypothetical protein
MIKSLLPVPLECDVQYDVIAAYERVGCVVARMEQSYRRGSRREPGTPGVPDLYVFPPLREDQAKAARRGHAAIYAAPWWHETKRLGGLQSPEQIKWQGRCAARGVAYVLGGVSAALAHLRQIGLVRG